MSMTQFELIFVYDARYIRIHSHSFTHGYPIVSALFIEKITLSIKLSGYLTIFSDLWTGPSSFPQERRGSPEKGPTSLLPLQMLSSQEAVILQQKWLRLSPFLPPPLKIHFSPLPSDVHGTVAGASCYYTSLGWRDCGHPVSY